MTLPITQVCYVFVNYLTSHVIWTLSFRRQVNVLVPKSGIHLFVEHTVEGTVVLKRGS